MGVVRVVRSVERSGLVLRERLVRERLVKERPVKERLRERVVRVVRLNGRRRGRRTEEGVGRESGDGVLR